ncbi:hypothetical protein FF100_27570 [Methylobacterium terricola]|uniref:Uncharacterized protein n=1 Tax=Methylobacterium terricola TaxID=2583531 RepID=A0A5C4LCD4_9HYPH|nr:hypothetical protein [Methylobacterium terricola]TNC09065.1 hypothetical protein FF100_27570 [Methylobacterium terricola]
MIPLENSKYRIYNVSNDINFILDAQNSLHLRAIRLYKMQIAVLFGHKLNDRQRDKKEYPDQYLAVSNDVLASADACAATKLLWHIDKTYKIEENLSENYLDNPDARDILRNILRNPGSIRKFAVAHSPRMLDLKLQIRRRHQRRCAPLYDFSLRYDVEDTKQKGGWKTALSLFNQKQGTDAHATIRKYYPYLGGETVGKQCRKEWDFLAGFVWNGHFGSQLFQPKRTSWALFARNLLEKAGDLPGLRRAVGEYQFVKARLEERDYELLTLNLAHPLPPAAPTLQPLPEDLLDAVSYKES